MTNLSASLLALRSAYGAVHRRWQGEGLSGEAATLELFEALVEQLPPGALSHPATQATLLYLLDRLPESPGLVKWLGCVHVHLFSSGVKILDPLYSRLNALPAEVAP